MNDGHDLEALIRSRTPIIAIESREEGRALELLRSLRLPYNWPLFKWSVTEGLVSLAFDFDLEKEHLEPAQVLRHIKQRSGPGVYVLVDFHPYLDDPVTVRLLKDIAMQYPRSEKTLVLLSHALTIPDELRNFGATFRLSLPDPDSIRQIVKQVARQWAQDNPGRKVKADRQSLDLLIANLGGLTAAEVRRLAHRAIHDDGVINGDDLPRITKAKYELLGRDGILHFIHDIGDFSDIGGFRHLHNWLAQRRAAFRQTDHGLDRPRGILLLGVQGCGKSLAAKAVAGIWGIPLLRMDFAALFNKFHGETERNLRESLRAAEVMAPCVLWVDEIEKGISTGDHDGGTSKRVLGSLLTWMAENTAPVFLVATANDITSLPPELIRKGRLDEIFFVDLPDIANRKQIFEIHLRRRGHDPLNFNSGELARLSEGFSGAEIEQCVVAALYAAQSGDAPLSDELLQEEIRRTRPLSVLMAEKIDALRNWARDRTVSADAP